MKIKERTIDNLRLYHEGHITVYFKDEETYWSFMREVRMAGAESQTPIMSDFQSLSAYRRSQPVRVTPPLHR